VLVKKWIDECREELDECNRHGTGWIYMQEDKQSTTIDNLACQLNSVVEVSNIWEAHYAQHPEEYAAVAFMRPDVQYQCDFPVHLVPTIQACNSSFML
jgi:hypothetical protein